MPDVQCSVCKQVFPTFASLRSHRAATVTCRDTECPTCNKILATLQCLASHCSAMRHGPGFSICQFCQRRFKSLSGLQSHMNALGHFSLATSPAAKRSKTTKKAGSGSIKSNQNPSTYLDGRGEISDATNRSSQECPASQPTLTQPTSSNLNRNVKKPSAVSVNAKKSLAPPSRNLNCAFCDASFGSPSAVAHHIESGCHLVTRHQVTAAVYAMNVVPNITTQEIESPPSFSATIETYVATTASFNGVGYQCHLCLQPPFSTLRALDAHLNSAAHDDCKFKCPKSKCNRKFKLISAFLQHLESGCCGLADIPEITGYFHDLRAQFSGLLKM